MIYEYIERELNIIDKHIYEIEKKLSFWLSL